MENEGVLNKSKYEFSEKSEIIQTIIIALLAFLVPTFLGTLINAVFGKESAIASNSQIIVGSIVNTALVISAINLKGWKKIILVITMPSISAIFGGVVLKTSAVFAMYMIPGIWIGNLALILAFKYLFVHKNLNYFVAGIIGIIAKVAIIFVYFMILKTLNIFPDKVVESLQYSMGIMQAITATIGVIIAFGINKIEENKIGNQYVLK